MLNSYSRLYLTVPTSLVLALAAIGEARAGYEVLNADSSTIANHQIVSDPLTAGVSTFTYGGLGISLVSRGQALFLASDRVSPFVAVERPAAVPEPTSLVMLGIGAVGMLGYARRRRGG